MTVNVADANQRCLVQSFFAGAEAPRVKWIKLEWKLALPKVVT
jgi:hypothetical protein